MEERSEQSEQSEEWWSWLLDQRRWKSDGGCIDRGGDESVGVAAALGFANCSRRGLLWCDFLLAFASLDVLYWLLLRRHCFVSLYLHLAS